ncbi:ParA family protein (plasmid) [Shewanella xiamenensis]|uniref:ParA family protein n=1 Tax=Shewanella xiamenensis TaxID=332186 RepID=A0ABT6UG15_9GAMM|nr:ParA family protein [Shewanella xiamenensis]MDI5833341.1 ParA family protein [Shewanella xiamenensis]WHF57907.1 ParA family protein [Shewanella xiamenensis]
MSTATGLAEIEKLSARLNQNDYDRKELMRERANESTSIDSLIVRHSIPQTQAAKACGMSLNTFKERLTEAVDKGIMEKPILEGNKYLFTLKHLHTLMDYFQSNGLSKLPKWADDKRECIVLNTGNKKGGTGKSTSMTNIAVAIALDLRIRMRVLIIDLDPQGSIRDMAVDEFADTSFMLTAVDLMLGDTEHASDLYKECATIFDSHKDIVKESILKTHIPNLHVLPAFPEDEEFSELAYTSGDLQGYLSKLKTNVIDHLVDDYDLIMLDSGPHSNPLVWSAMNASNAIFVPLSPRKLDWSSTKKYIKNLPNTLKALPSKGENLKFFKLAIVNFDDEQNRDAWMYNAIKDEVGRTLMLSSIKRSSAFEASARQSITVLDLQKNNADCPPGQVSKAERSIDAIKTEIINLFREDFPMGVR